jgi:Ca-activated chloride channel family protein
VLSLALVTLIGRAAIESDVFGTGGDIQPVSVEGNGIVLSGRLSHSAVLLNGDDKVQIELALKAEEREWASRWRVPTDLVVILDRSGSMDGEKIHDARAAVRELIAQLDAEDRFALVTYSDWADLSIPLAPATGEAKTRWKQIVRSVLPGGSTNMSEGIDLAKRISQGPSRVARMKRLILISDGLANAGDSTHEGLKSRARSVARQEHVLSAVGVGADFNEVLMSALADAGTGNYYYLEDSEELASVFAKEFDATRETVATAVAVVVEPGDGVELLDAAGYPLERDGRSVRFRPGTLFSGQERKVWLTFRVPNKKVGEFDLGKITMTYQDRGQQHRLSLGEVLRVACVTKANEFFASVDKEAWETAVLEEEYNRLQQDVARSVRSGRRDEALSRINEYRDTTSTMNAQIKSEPVMANIQQLEALEAEVDDAFQGANQMEKQNRLSKAKQAAGRDGRRKGSKK